MNYLRLSQFSQVKKDNFVKSNVNKLFNTFHMSYQHKLQLATIVIC